MTKQELKALGTRARDCARFKWLPGQLYRVGNRARGRVYSVDDEGRAWSSNGQPISAEAWPDLSDSCTLGGLVFGVLPSLSIRLGMAVPPFGPMLAVGWHDANGFHHPEKKGTTAEIAVMALECAK